jgi:hypothetical protein
MVSSIYNSGSQTEVRVPPGVRTRTFSGARKNCTMAEKAIIGLFTVTTYKFEIRATVVIINILPV